MSDEQTGTGQEQSGSNDGQSSGDGKGTGGLTPKELKGQYDSELNRTKTTLQNTQAQLADLQKQMEAWKGLDPNDVKERLRLYSEMVDNNKDNSSEDNERWRADVQKEFQTHLDAANSKAETLEATVKDLTVKNEAMPFIIKNFKEDSHKDVEKMLLMSVKIQDGEIVLVDDDGKVMHSKNQERIGQNMTVTEWLENFKSARPSIALSTQSGGGRQSGTASGDQGGGSGFGYDDYKTMGNVERAKNFTPQQRQEFAARSIKERGLLRGQQ